MAIILKFKRMGYSSKTMKCKRKRQINALLFRFYQDNNSTNSLIN